MKPFITVSLFCLAAGISKTHAGPVHPPKEQTVISRDSITRDGYTLIFVNQDADFAQAGAAVKQRMIETFFQVYPELAKAYNPATLKKVVFDVDPAYDGVAATTNGVVRYNPKWMLRTPTDIDVVTHEVMHIVQDYRRSIGPGWLTEGIADYVRYQFGVDNPGARWSLPDYNADQHYTNSYRITARFLAWLEANRKAGIVKTLDESLRAHTYTAAIWQQQTGKTLDELWAAYTADPVFTVKK
ncbi:basic secretory protein-like protein [Chitinophaga sp. 30R24]|uniref:basic secretory protein-like protein n=1 Tax=Chitinophaga sp. 30R24 TaxID=3248838 RepID=UPI003B91BAB1